MEQPTENREPVPQHVPTYSPSSFDAADFDAAMNAQLSGTEAAAETAQEPGVNTAEGSPDSAQGVIPTSPGGTTEAVPAQGTEPQGEPAGDALPGPPPVVEEAKKRDRTIHGRIADLVAERNEWRERAIQLEQGRPPATPAVEPPSVQPSAGQPALPQIGDAKYAKEDGEIDTAAYHRDVAEYTQRLAQWTVSQTLAERDRQAAVERARAEQARIAATSAEREHSYAEANPDFLPAVQTLNALIVDGQGRPVSRQAHDVLTLIRQSEDGPKIAHYLGQHPEEALGLLHSRDPLSLGLAFENTRFRATAASQPKQPITTPAQESVLTQLAKGVQTSKAPQPITTIDGRSGPVERPLDGTDIEEFMRRTGTTSREVTWR